LIKNLKKCEKIAEFKHVTFRLPVAHLVCLITFFACNSILRTILEL